MKIISSYGQIRRYTDKQWKEWLKAVVAGDYNKADAIERSAKLIGNLHAETADLTREEAQERLDENR